MNGTKNNAGNLWNNPMPDRLIVLLVILGVAWLIDRGWQAFGKPAPATKSKPASKPPTENPPEKNDLPKKRIPTSKLRKDWLQLGRRFK